MNGERPPKNPFNGGKEPPARIVHEPSRTLRRGRYTRRGPLGPWIGIDIMLEDKNAEHMRDKREAIKLVIILLPLGAIGALLAAAAITGYSVGEIIRWFIGGF